MHHSQFPSTNSQVLSHPILNFQPDQSEKEKAKALKELLISISKQPEVTEYRSILRRAADSIREQAFGVSEKKITSKLNEAFEEYFDGAEYRFVEISDLEDLTGIGEKYLLPVLEKMIGRDEVETSRRRRWNEPGKHYNQLYRLKK